MPAQSAIMSTTKQAKAGKNQCDVAGALAGGGAGRGPSAVPVARFGEEPGGVPKVQRGVFQARLFRAGAVAGDLRDRTEEFRGEYLRQRYQGLIARRDHSAALVKTIEKNSGNYEKTVI